MARIRTIKPGFFRSHDVTPLSYRARLTWIGLWTYVDDEGRGKDDARIIKGDLWTLEDNVTWQDVEDDLTELSLSAHVVRYSVDGRHFLAIPKWLEHQVISRPTASKFPAPDPMNIRDSAPFTDDSMSTHGANTAGTGNREQGNGTGNREVELSPRVTEIKPVIAELFDSAYEHWPKKVERADALKRFTTATKKVPAAQLAEHVIRFGDAYAATTDRQFTPALGAWLNGERWTDELPTSAPRKETRGDSNLDYVRGLYADEQRQQMDIQA
jgi:hypothetical protein